jgi:excisionase family DNA binding protein
MLLTVEQAAERLGTSVRFLRRLRTAQRSTINKLGGHIRIDSTDLGANRHEGLGARTRPVASDA